MTRTLPGLTLRWTGVPVEAGRTHSLDDTSATPAEGDVLVVTGSGTCYWAHGCVLAAGSRLWRTALYECDTSSSARRIHAPENVPHGLVRSLIDGFYTGRVVCPRNATALVTLAQLAVRVDTDPDLCTELLRGARECITSKNRPSSTGAGDWDAFVRTDLSACALAALELHRVTSEARTLGQTVARVMTGGTFTQLLEFLDWNVVCAEQALHLLSELRSYGPPELGLDTRNFQNCVLTLSSILGPGRFLSHFAPEQSFGLGLSQIGAAWALRAVRTDRRQNTTGSDRTCSPSSSRPSHTVLWGLVAGGGATEVVFGDTCCAFRIGFATAQGESVWVFTRPQLVSGAVGETVGTLRVWRTECGEVFGRLPGGGSAGEGPVTDLSLGKLPLWQPLFISLEILGPRWPRPSLGQRGSFPFHSHRHQCRGKDAALQNYLRNATVYPGALRDTPPRDGWYEVGFDDGDSGYITELMAAAFLFGARASLDLFERSTGVICTC